MPDESLSLLRQYVSERSQEAFAQIVRREVDMVYASARRQVRDANYLLEILRYIPTDEVKLTFKAPERAATLEPEGWSDPASYLTLVMPLRLVD